MELSQQLFGEAPKVEPTAATPPTETKTETPTQAVTQPSATPSQPEAPKGAEPPKAQPEASHIPIAALLDERDKRKKAEERLQQLEAQHRKPQQAPSVQDDPEGFAQYVQQVQERAVISSRFDMSQTMAEEKHGGDIVKAAMDWGMQRSQESPAFAAEYLKQKHPIDWAVRQHKRALRDAEIGDDFDSYFEREAAKRGFTKSQQPGSAPQAQPQATPAAPQPVAPPRPQPPPPSLVNAPSAGGPKTAPAAPSAVEVQLFGRG